MSAAQVANTIESTEEAAQQTPEEKRKACLIKGGIAVVLVGLVTWVIIDYSTTGNIQGWLTDFLNWVEDNPGLGVLAFAGVYWATTIMFIPGSILTLGAGLVFGRALGLGLGLLLASLAVFIGASLGAICAFLLGRYVLQEQAQKWFNKFKVMRAVDAAIETQGLKLVLLLRLSPVIPFSAFNYIMGLTRVKFRDYVIGCLGMIPGTVAYCFIGSTAGGLLGGEEEMMEESGSGRTVQIVVLVVGLVATFIAVFLLSWYAKKALNKALADVDNAEGEGAAVGGGENA